MKSVHFVRTVSKIQATSASVWIVKNNHFATETFFVMKIFLIIKLLIFCIDYSDDIISILEYFCFLYLIEERKKT